MKSWFAPIIAAFALWAGGGTSAMAASPDCAVEGGQLLSWPAGDPVWEMCWIGPGESVGPRGSGLELRAVHYNGILVAKKIHSPMLFAEYTHGTCYRDWMDDPSPILANNSTHNQLGTPTSPTRTAITSCSVSTHPTQSFGTCNFGQTPQAGESCTTGQHVVIENLGDHVRLVTQYRADWYMYDSRISFYTDGDIEPTFGFGNRNGTENGTTHWHHNYWRFDFDIGEAANNMLAINDVDQTTEFAGVRGAVGSTTWSVRNTATGRGYRLVPGSNDYNVTPNQAGFGYHPIDVMGTRFVSGEINDGGVNLSDCALHQNTLVNGENIQNQDVVLYYHAAVRDSTANDWPEGCSGASCIPQDSMVCKTAGPRLEQFGDWGPTGGTNHIVTANANMTFTPSELTIAEGDTVTFQNAGGNHNVVATSGPTTFRCANGCDGDGNGGNGNLSTANWSATVAFPTAGELTFFCEAHGAADGTGMAGTITVQGDPPPPPPVAGTITDGSVERAFGEGTGTAFFNSTGANGSDGPLAADGDDIVFKTNWYFRVGGATQETMFGLPDGMIYDASGDRATLFYEGLGDGAFDAELDVVVSEPATGQAAQISNMTIHNLGSTPLTIDVFNYTDLDANGSFSADSGADISADGNVIIEVTDAADTLQVGGRGATAYQVNEWATDTTELPQTLENTDVTNLDNTGLPFVPGDFTSTIQWTESVPASGSVELRHGITRGTDVAPFFGDGPLLQADLSLALSAAPDPVNNGEDVTFTANVSNAGPEAATEVSVTLTLPDELVFQSATPAAWMCADASGVVTCDLSGSIASGASAAALSIVAMADTDENGTVTADGLVDGNPSDPAGGNNAVSVEVEIAGIVDDAIFCDGFEEGGDGSCDGGAGNPDIVVVDDLNFVPQATGTGSSINWLTGATCDCDSGDFHFNIWLSGGNMAFYLPIWVDSGVGAADVENGFVANGTTPGTSLVSVLAPGATIGPDSSFLLGSTASWTTMAANWRQAGNVDGYLGFRFLNTDTGEVNFGYAHLTTTGTTGFPATIVGYAYNSAGDPIDIEPLAVVGQWTVRRLQPAHVSNPQPAAHPSGKRKNLLRAPGRAKQ